MSSSDNDKFKAPIIARLEADEASNARCWQAFGTKGMDQSVRNFLSEDEARAHAEMLTRTGHRDVHARPMPDEEAIQNAADRRALLDRLAQAEQAAMLALGYLGGYLDGRGPTESDRKQAIKFARIAAGLDSPTVEPS